MKKRTLVRLITFPLAACGLMMGMCVYQAELTADYERLLGNTYEQGVFDLAASVSEIERELERSLVFSAPANRALCTARIMTFAAKAKGALVSFPIYGENTEVLSLYLAQVGEYCFSLTEKAIGGAPYTAAERESLEEMLAYTKNLGRQLDKTQAQVLNGQFLFDPLLTPVAVRAGRMQIGKTEAGRNGAFCQIGNERTYSPLLYDGNYSDHRGTETEYAALYGKESLEESVVKERAAAFLGTTVEELENFGKSEGTPALYTFGTADMRLDILGTGDVLCLVNGRALGGAALSAEEAAQKAKDFLAMSGYEGLELVEQKSAGGVSYCTFSHVQGDTIFYTDKLLVGIALDKGDVVDFYTKDYLQNHTDTRSIPKGRMDLEKAHQKAPEGHTVGSSRYAVIASQGGFEQHAVELSTSKEEREYLYYIDALQGLELALVSK